MAVDGEEDRRHRREHLEQYASVDSVVQAVNLLHRDSFVTYTVDDDTAAAIDVATREEREVLHSPDDQLHLHQRIIDGHLHGFNIPSPAKRLFRAFCGSPLQPWPNPGFQKAATAVAARLHLLLLEFCFEIEKLRAMEERTVNEAEVYENSSRKRDASSVSSLALALDETAEDSRACPLDFFLYHGPTNRGVVNCSEHVDRGLLIAVCLTPVPGLEVLPRSVDEFKFFCPEDFLLTRTRSSEEPSKNKRYVCIVAGDQLQQLHPDFPACLHRVKNDLVGERISITYEFRSPATKR